MKSSMLLAAALAALVAVPALAQPAAEGAPTPNEARQTCLQFGRIWSWKAPNNRTLIVENDSHQKFKLDLMGTCPGLTFKEALAFRSPGGSYLTCITPGDSVFFHDIGMETRCIISKVTPYTAEMEKADMDAKAKK